MANTVELFNELIRLGYVSPKSDYPDLTMPTMYRSVPSITTAGTAVEPTGNAASAKLERGTERDSGD